MAAAAYAAFALPWLRWPTARWLALGFAVAVGLKFAAGLGAPPVGLKASYFSHATTEGTVERSTDFPNFVDATRVDERLDLRGEDFPVHFFNDAARFNFGADVQPGRDQLPFSVRWQGWLLAPSDGQRRFVLESTGPAQVWLDEAPLPGPDDAVNVTAGLHSLRVEYSRPETRVPRLHLSWQRHPGGPLETVGAPDARWQPSTTGTQTSSLIGSAADLGIGAVVAAWLVLGLLRARSGGLTRAALGAVPLVFLVHGVLLQAPLAWRATILSGLDDWLIHESSARDILLNGPLLDGGLGHAPAFYAQPLYPYVLAVAHRFTGESIFGPLVLQFAALGLVVVGTAVLARRAFGSRLDGLVALAFFSALLQLEPEHFKVARQLFNENLYMPLTVACLIVVVGLAARRTPVVWWQSVAAGVLLGLTAISRSQFLLFVPFVLLILLLAWRHNLPWATKQILCIAAGLLLAIAPVTARNGLVSGQLVPISTSAGASLLEFHRPPPGLIDQTALEKDAVFNALHLDAQTRTVLAFARADLPGYVATLLPPGAHSLGLQGRNDPGVYWPLFLTVLLYLASFSLARTRRLHVWPIHAFVATHLLVMMLFEAQTYGYRLVMPMYAPMAAVAALVPLALVRAVTRSRLAAFMRSGDPARATRFAHVGWSLVAVAALLWQAKSLAQLWPDRETNLHGLAGAAAHAATTGDRISASAIYVASIDGTPRRFGAGTLPGLRYPWFKWFDPARGVPLPSPSTTSVYLLSELVGHNVAGDLVSCLGATADDAEIVLSGERAQEQCVNGLRTQASVGVRFDGVAQVEAVQVPDEFAAGDTAETRLVWRPLIAHPEPQQVSLQLDDPAAGDGTLWGNSTLELYPARQWQPDEAVLSRLPLSTDPTATPGRYRLTLGIGPIRPNAPSALASWQGVPTARVPVTMVTLAPGSAPLDQALPPDMRAIEGPPLSGGGLQLVGARPLPAEAAIGSPLRIGMLWRATRDAPQAARVKLRLMRGSGEIVQETVLPVLGGRLAPSALHAGNVVRDEQTMVISTRVPSEQLSLEAELLDAQGAPLEDAAVRIGSLKMVGRAHVFESSEVQPQAVFGERIQLLSHGLEPSEVRASGKLTVKLRWRSASEMERAFKVFVHVLDEASQKVVAQRDAEPQDGRAPTTGWVPGEVLDDEYAIALPASVASGEYSIEVGIYDPRTGDRLALPNGDNRFILSARVRVR